MLNMIVPDWSENEDLYKVKLKNYIEQLRNQCIITLENNESIEEIISNTINTSKLYFAQTNAAHLLKPLMDVAKKINNRKIHAILKKS